MTPLGHAIKAMQTVVSVLLFEVIFKTSFLSKIYYELCTIRKNFHHIGIRILQFSPILVQEKSGNPGPFVAFKETKVSAFAVLNSNPLVNGPRGPRPNKKNEAFSGFYVESKAMQARREAGTKNSLAW
jgi:hypothetical protein